MPASRHAQARQPPPAALAGAATFSFLLLLAVPRIVRMAYPQVWIEDESYLNGAFMLGRGWLPYRDFPLPHFPALEGLLAAVFLIAPISIRTVEALTQLAAFLGSALVFRLGRELERTAGAPPHTSTAAGIVFATSALLFRYHVFEREVFVVPAVVGAVLAVGAGGSSGVRREPRAAERQRAGDGPREPTDGRAGLAGALLALAMMFKLTAVAALAAVIVHLWVAGRRRAAGVVAGAALGTLAAAGVALTAAFGTDFLVQVALFRVVHATFPSLAVKLDEMRYTLDVSLALGGTGTVLLFWNGAWRRWAGPLLQLASAVVFLVVLNPTYWPHTGIELLPWLALPAGYLVASAGDARLKPRAPGLKPRAPGLKPRAPGLKPRAPRQRALVCATAAVVLLFTIVPFRNLNWEAGDGSPYGFGYRSRSEIAAAAAYVRAHSRPDAPVATPPIIAFAANRRELIPYAEVAGEVDELTTGVRRDGWLATLRSQADRRGTFWESVEASRDRMTPKLEQALVSRTAALVINDSPDDLFPLQMIDVAEQTLEADGYRLGASWPHYDAWIAP